MALRARLKVVRQGALHSLTIMNGFFLFMTILFAFDVAEHFDDAVSYALSVTGWVFAVYWHMFGLVGHVMELEEKLAEPNASLQAMREHLTALPILGMLPFVLLR
jgi:hypothetical protein